jgi:hypothetical protein
MQHHASSKHKRLAWSPTLYGGCAQTHTQTNGQPYIIVHHANGHMCVTLWGSPSVLTLSNSIAVIAAARPTSENTAAINVQATPHTKAAKQQQMHPLYFFLPPRSFDPSTSTTSGPTL